MTTTTAPARVVRGGWRQALADGLVVMWRNLKRIPRIPELAIFAVIQSIMFVLLFAFVFGGAIPLPGYPGPNAYREYLMPGIFVQTIAFASATTAIGMTDDMAKGIIDRFRSLPMARSAVLTGRSFADTIYQTGILVVLMVSGLLVGWSVNNGIVDFLHRCRPAHRVRVHDVLGRHLAGPVGAHGRGRSAGRLRGHLPHHVHLQRLRAHPDDARLAPAVRGVEPGEHADDVAAHPVGQPQPPFATNNLPSQQPILVTIGWVVVLLGVFVPLGVRKYRSTSR